MPNQISDQPENVREHGTYWESTREITQKIWDFWGVATSSEGFLSRKLLVLLIMSLPVKWPFKAHMSGGLVFGPALA